MNIVEIQAKPKEEKITRVAAYARVSIEKEATFHSLEAQRDYYRDYVTNHPSWVLVDVYSDNGISGTTRNRPEFQRMLEDCRAGKVDLVITKSITRFARNTVILLETIRELKKLGIDCYFEKENMHSISSDGELLLTLLAMYAEEEARSASENVKWKIRKKFENGEIWSCNLFGYRQENGKLYVISEEAEIVRQIFDWYLQGYGITSIIKRLTDQNYRTRQGKVFSETGIRKMLRNEKYKGDLLLQKTWRDDFGTKKFMVNNGELPRYYVEDAHEAIISKDVFEKVQKEIERRKAVHNKDLNKDKSFNIYKGLLVCGCCGCHFSRKRPRGTNPATYICISYIKNKNKNCEIRWITEKELIRVTKLALGTTEIDRSILDERIEKIVVGLDVVSFMLKNGEVLSENRIPVKRRKGWTEGQKQRARERADIKRRKEMENAESNSN